MKILYIVIAIAVVTMSILTFISTLSSCTYSITQVHTQGQASDVVDETSTNSPSTSVKIPTRAL